jgi:hypothetical protein
VVALPDIQNAFGLPWTAAVEVQGAWGITWTQSSGEIQSLGTAFTQGTGGGGTPTNPGGQTPGAEIPSGAYYPVTNTISVIDLRDNTELPIENVSMTLEDGGAFWSLRAQGRPLLFQKLTTGPQPALVKVTINGVEWRCVVEQLDATRAFANNPVAIGGRSLAALCDAPYQFSQQWVTDAPTTAAQICAIANTFTSVEVEWQMDDWFVPAGAWSFQGTPMDAVRAVAGAAGAVIEASRTEQKLFVRSRYPTLPNEWPTRAPDVQVAWSATDNESYSRADQPAYDGVLVAGQSQGAWGLVRYAGTAGTNQSPMITDPLLTDLPALRERGKSILGRSGKQALVTRSLQLRTGSGLPGLIERGAIIRFVDPGETWEGIVRSVTVSAAFGGAVRQVVTVERHLEYITGSYVPPPPALPPAAFFAPCTNNGDDLILPAANNSHGSFAGGATFDSAGALLNATTNSQDYFLWTSLNGSASAQKLNVALRNAASTITFSAEIEIVSTRPATSTNWYPIMTLGVPGSDFGIRTIGFQGNYFTGFSLPFENIVIWSQVGQRREGMSGGLYEIVFGPSNSVVFKIDGTVYRSMTFARSSSTVDSIFITAGSAAGAGHKNIRVRNVKMVVT